MSFDILIQEANGLSEDKIAEVISFIQFLKTKDISKSDNTPGQYRTPGGLKGKCVLADDFDKTPDCFKDLDTEV